MRTARARIAHSLIVASLSLILLVTMMHYDNHAILTVHASGTPDSYGNYIFYIYVGQWNGSEYVVLTAAHYYDYDNNTGIDVTVEPEMKMRFDVMIMLNSTLAASQAEAQARTRVKFTLEDVYTDQAMTWQSTTGPTSGFYQLLYSTLWDVAGEPVGGRTYSFNAVYEANYD